MPTPESLLEDASFLIKKLSALQGDELKSICRDLNIPVKNMPTHDMVEQILITVNGAIQSYRKAPKRESERILAAFRYNILVKSKFVERCLDRLKKTMPD
jgi:DNA polymerase II small subunit/DNA polymerase delta subunit B